MDASSDQQWKPLSLTLILYPTGDFIGQILALISLAPFGVIVAFFTLTLFVRDIHVIFFFIGQLLNEVLCLTLKKAFPQSRPVQIVGARKHSNTSSGMPSQHSQFMAFFAFYCLLFFVYRLKRKSIYYKSFLMTIITLLMCSVIYSRVYLKYHFWSQCLAGVVAGSGFAVIWFFIVNNIIEPTLFAKILRMKLSRFLGLTSVYIEPKKKNVNNDVMKKRK